MNFSIKCKTFFYVELFFFSWGFSQKAIWLDAVEAYNGISIGCYVKISCPERTISHDIRSDFSSYDEPRSVHCASLCTLKGHEIQERALMLELWRA
jgi:hypothetical protein